MARQHFVLRGDYVGGVERDKILCGNVFLPPPGQALFCPICAEVWLLAPVVGEGTTVSLRPCEKHEPGERLGNWSTGSASIFSIPGSVWCDWDAAWNDALPKVLLQRELLLTLNFYERYYHEPEAN